MKRARRLFAMGLALVVLNITRANGAPPDESAPAGKSLARQAADAFLKAFGDHPGFRFAHAKGIVCEGSFTPTKEAAALSKAAHFKGDPVPVVVRFSDGTGIPEISDSDPRSNPKGFAIRFKLPNGDETDIVSNGANGFLVSTPEDFVGFLTAVGSTKPDSPHPTPIEQFLAAHPATAERLAKPSLTPASFGTQAYFGNDAFVFTNASGKKQPFRYQIIPVAGEKHLDPADAAKKPADFLMDELKQRLAEHPVEFRLMAQLAAPGDPTSDAMKVWPEDRPKVDLGVIRIMKVDPRSDEAQKELAFDPINLTDGIDLSDDPLPSFRSKVYALSVKHRN